ncbi:uncharacterized protein RHO17_021802 [Thomomys bottae]
MKQGYPTPNWLIQPPQCCPFVLLTSLAMLLPLLGACAVVGPFQGPEWEPVRGLLSQDCSCKDPRCCGNLLVLCLFLIWQVRHFWHCIIRTRLCKRNGIKVQSQKRAMSSERHGTFFGIPSGFFHLDKLKDTHVKQLVEKQRRLQKPWVQPPPSPQMPPKDPPWNVHTLSQSIFCTSSFSSTHLLPQDSSSKAERTSWRLRDSETHLRLHTCQQVEQMLVHSQEKLVPAEPAVNSRYPTSMPLAMSVPNLSAQRLQFFHGEFLPDPPSHHQKIPTCTSSNSSQENGVPQRETQAVGRENNGETQAPWGMNQRESRGQDAWGIQTSRGQLLVGYRMKDGTVTKALGYKSLKTLITKADGKTWTPVWENQNHVGVENQILIGDQGKKKQKEAPLGENQVGLRWKTDAETQTPEWGNQGDGGSEGVVKTQSYEKREARREEKGEETQVHGWTGGENGYKSQMPQQETQGQADIGAETEAEEKRNQEQAGSTNAVQTQISRRENLGEIQQDDDDIETRALEWGKQRCTGNEKLTEIQIPVGDKQGQNGNKKARDTQEFRIENQNLSRCAVRGGWEKQSLGRVQEAEECQITRRKKHREIRQEDWVVIQAAWWENQRVVANKIQREFDIPCWRNQMHLCDEFRAEILVPENDQRKGGNKEDTLILAPEAKNQRHLRCDMDIYPVDRKSKIGDENGIDFQALEKKNLRRVSGKTDVDTQELVQEYPGQLRNEFHQQIHILKWKNQEHIKDNNNENTLTSEAEKWGGLISNFGGETHSSGWKKGEQIGCDNDAEMHIQDMRVPREAGMEDATEIREAREGSQSQLGHNRDGHTHLSEGKNKPIGVEDGTEKTRNKREQGRKDEVKNHRPERKSWRQLESRRRSRSLGRGSWELPGAENPAEKQASMRTSQRITRSEDGRKMQRFKRKKQRPIGSKVNRKISSAKLNHQVQIRGRNATEIKKQRKRNVKKITGDSSPETQIPVEDDQVQEIQTQGQENQNKGEFEDASEILDVRNERKGRGERGGWSGAPRRGNNHKVGGGMDALRICLQSDGSASESEDPSGGKPSLTQFPALVASENEALEHRQTVIVNSIVSAPCSEMKHKAGVTSASPKAGPRSQRRQQRSPSSHTWQSQDPQSSEPSVCPSCPYDQAPQAATALVGVSTALDVIPTWPTLRKTKRELLESLMRRRIAHLRWGLPWRILESYLIFNFLRSCSLPVAEVRLPGLCTNQELQRHGGIQGSKAGLKSPERSQGFPPPERKSLELPTSARPFQKCRPLRSESLGSAIPPVKPRRTRPPGGVRDPQVQEEVSKSNILAPRNSRSALEFRSRRGPVRVLDLSNEDIRGREMSRTGFSLMAEGAPSRVSILSSRADQNYWKKEHTSWGDPEPSRLQCQQSAYHRRGSLKTGKDRGPEEQLSFYSTETSSPKESVHSVVTSTSMSLLGNRSWSPPLAKAQYSAPNLTLREPTLLPQVDDPHSSEDIVGIKTALERDFQPPEYFCAGVAFPQTESNQGWGTCEKTSWGPRNPPAPRKFGFIKRLRWFIFHGGFKK